MVHTLDMANLQEMHTRNASFQVHGFVVESFGD